MISFVVEYIQSVFLPLGAIGVFSISILEGIIVPIPSTAVLMSAGFFLLEGYASFFEMLPRLFLLIVIPATIGVPVGSLLVYGLVYKYGEVFISRWGKFIGVSMRDIESLKLRFEKTKLDEFLLVFLWAMPIIPSSAIAAWSGLVKLRLFKHMIIAGAGTLLKSTILGIIGWRAGVFYFAYADVIERLEKYVLMFIVALIFAFLSYRIYKRNRVS